MSRKKSLIGGEPLSVGRKFNRAHEAGVVVEAVGFMAQCKVPEARRVIDAAGGQSMAVGRKVDGQDATLVSAHLQHADLAYTI